MTTAEKEELIARREEALRLLWNDARKREYAELVDALEEGIVRLACEITGVKRRWMCWRGQSPLDPMLRSGVGMVDAGRSPCQQETSAST